MGRVYELTLSRRGWTVKATVDEIEELDAIKHGLEAIFKRWGLIENQKPKTLENIKAQIPPEILDLLNFEEKENAITIKPRQFLGAENFARIASKIRDLGGEYISAGKESYFKIPKQG